MTQSAATARHIRRLAAVLLCGVLAACGYDPVNLVVNQKEVEDQSTFTPVPLSQSWVNVNEMTFVMQRGLLGGSEQRIGLENKVVIPGDNHLILRTRSGAVAAGRFRFEELMERVGGAPEPFGRVTSGDLITSEDEFGPYHWTEITYGSDITCVFAVRRISGSARSLPNDALLMDVMLRNCVPGTREEALEPVLAQTVAFARSAAAPVPDGTRLLSPLAGPGLN